MSKKRNWAGIAYGTLAAVWATAAIDGFGNALGWWDAPPPSRFSTGLLALGGMFWMLGEVRATRPAAVLAKEMAEIIESHQGLARVSTTIDTTEYSGAEGLAAAFAFSTVALRVAGMDRARVHAHADAAMNAVEARLTA